MTTNQRSPSTTRPFVEKIRDDLSGERFTIVARAEDHDGATQVPIEYTLDGIFRVMEGLGVSDMETIELIKAARMAFWRAGRGVR